MHALLAALALVAADPQAPKLNRPELLKKFRKEFLHITRPDLSAVRSWSGRASEPPPVRPPIG